MRRESTIERPWITPFDRGFSELTIAVRGVVGARESRALEREVLEGVLRGRRSVVIDLRGVTGVGAGLLGAILRIRRGLSGVNGDLALVVDHGPVQELVGVSVLRELVAVAPTRNEARKLLSDDRPPPRRRAG